MSSQNQYYSLVALNDHLRPTGFAHLSASLLMKKSPLGREIKVIVGSPSKVSDATVIKFAKKLTKHMRVSRGWSAVSVDVQSMEIPELPPHGTPQQTEGNLTAWIVD
jgi:hypothetical protein